MTALAATVGCWVGICVGALVAGPVGALIGGFAGATVAVAAACLAVAIITPPEWDGDPFEEPEWQNPVQR